MTSARMTPPPARITGNVATTVDLLRAAAQQQPEAVAYVDEGRRMSFGEWDRAADGLASLLHDQGIGKGDVLCLMLPSCIDYAVSYQAAMRLGAISTGIDLRFGRNEVASMIAQAEPAVVICEDDAEAPAGVKSVLRRAALAAAYDAGPPRRLPSLDPTDPVAIVWTSGSTGRPKGAVYDHARLEVMAGAAGVISSPGDRRLATLAFAHVGYMTRLWDDVVNVIENVIVPQPWRAEHALRVIDEESVTVGQGTPTQWWLMLRHENFAATDWSHMRVAGVGGASVPPELVREIRDRVGCPVVVRYASTEMCTGTSTAVDDPPEVTARTVGTPNAGVEMRLVGDDRVPVAHGDVGIIQVRSGAVMREYWRAPELTAEVLTEDGWLTTGDLGSWDADGNLQIAGRRTDMYVRGGFNVYPAEVEGVLGDHPQVAQAGVVGVPDPVLGEIGAAFVVPAPGGAPTLDELRGWVGRHLADYKAPDRLELVQELPMTAMQKLDKRALRTQASRAWASPSGDDRE